MDAKRELSGIGDGLGKVGQGIASIFDKDQRAARKAIADAQREAATQIAAEKLQATKDALKASTEEAIKKIKAGVGEAASATGAVPPAAPSGFFARGAQSVGNRMQSAFKGGVWLIEQPIALVLKPVKWVANGVGNAFVKAPVKSTAVAGVAALVAGGTWLANRRSKVMLNEFEAQAMAAQAAQPSYMNSVSPADMEAMNAKLRVNEAGHANVINAARERVQAPEAARA